MKKLLLTYPNQLWQKFDITTTWVLNPATLCGLAAMVKDIVEVKIIDANYYNLTQEQFEEDIRKFEPDYVGISVLTSEYGITLDIAASIVKGVNSKTIVIAGGVHPTIEFMTVIQNTDIDYVCRGEGEHVFRDLLLYLDGKGNAPKEGFVFKKPGGVEVQSQAIVSDLSKLPWPDFSLITLEDYLYTEHRKGPQRPPAMPYYRLRVTRGCPFRCSFCQVESINGLKIRTRDPKDVVNEIICYKEKYGLKALVFDDDNLNGAKAFFKKVLQLMIEKEVNLPWQIIAFAVWLLDDEMLDLMSKAGCTQIIVAIESGNQRVLNEIVQKPINLEKIPPLIQKVKQKRITVLANFIVGFPGEKWDEIRETIRYAENCGADYVKIFIAVPLKNTKMWEMAESLDSFESDANEVVVDWRNGQLKTDEWCGKDISILRAYEWDRINFNTPEKRAKVAEIWGISEEEMNQIRKETRDALFN
jgi:anaerobic magnesium-protoporphyrin IX monomethyl ester cyclase